MTKAGLPFILPLVMETVQLVSGVFLLLEKMYLFSLYISTYSDFKLNPLISLVQLLLDNGADPNQRDGLGNTPLHLGTIVEMRRF